MAVWLASSGDRAIAEGEQTAAITKSTAMKMVKPVDLVKGRTDSQVTFVETEGVVHRLAVFVDVESAQDAKVYLTSPSGTRVLVVDGARLSEARKQLRGWFGHSGEPTAESLAAFSGEPVTGAWKLSIDSERKGRLKMWSLSADLSSNTKMAGMETYGEYGGDGGCDCRVGTDGTSMSTGMLMLLLLGLVLVRRR